MIFTNEASAAAVLLEWQKRLRLADWDVKVRICRNRDFNMEGKGAEISYVLKSRTALISLLDPLDYPEGRWPQDHEEDTVHELLHLHLAPFAPDSSDSLESVAEEQAINAIAEALVAARRQDRCD